jgi:crossover junction endodeoxyribonuclease RusA
VRYSGEVAVYVFAHPPDRRKRDLDNITKALLDALVGAGVLKDDHQVAVLYVERRPFERPGKVRLVVGAIESYQPPERLKKMWVATDRRKVWGDHD